MPESNNRGSKKKYTEKQKRKAEHIEETYEEKGVSKNEAEARAWATVNKQSGGGERKGGSGRKTAGSEKADARKDSARRAAATRQGKSRQGKLEDQTKDELMQQARKKDIAGRSKMKKQELVTALKKSA